MKATTAVLRSDMSRLQLLMRLPNPMIAKFAATIRTSQVPLGTSRNDRDLPSMRAPYGRAKWLTPRTVGMTPASHRLNRRGSTMPGLPDMPQ